MKNNAKSMRRKLVANAKIVRAAMLLKARNISNGICPNCGFGNGYDVVFEDDRRGDKVRLQFDCDGCGIVVDEWVIASN